MNGRIAFAFFSVGVLVFACGPRPHGGDSSTSARTARARIRDQDHARVLAASLDVKVVNVADGVRFGFRVMNTGEKKLEVNFPSGQTHDLVVLDTLGREVWRWSVGRMFTQALQNRVLRASDALEYEGRWREAAPGRYVAVATLSSANYPMEQRAEFIVR
ncbi:MAG TPA: BsuPI-related putative proteinase inhibitor [Gemmatimonadaceae bacterium]|nr:BsuPI-related putative proteinase inhibitor [Gemmatimonadaceae bacterium]